MKQPWQQGRFDGLCGVYSLINGSQSILRDFTETDGRRLFVHLIDTHQNDFPSMVWSGVDFNALWKMAEGLPTYLQRHGTVTVSKPFQEAHYEALDGFLDDLRGEISAQAAVAVVGLVNPRGHWTVIQDVLKRSLCFLDSCGLKEITPLEAISLKAGDGTHKIDYKQTIILRRVH